MFIPGKEKYTEMSAEQFEKFSLSFLQEQADELEKGVFEHNAIISTDDGNYQIDGKIEFQYLGVSFLCLVECKKYKNPIKREHIATLYAKMLSIGAQKGIFITTSYYQTGAIQFAEKHGIALIIITDEGMTYYRRGDDMPDIHLPVQGSMFVPVMTEAISNNSYRDYYLYDKANASLREFLIR